MYKGIQFDSILTIFFSLLLSPEPSRQGDDLVQQGFTLARGVLGHLLQQMLDRLARVRDGDALRRLDARDLEREEEFGHLDGEVPRFAADAGLGGQV